VTRPIPIRHALALSLAALALSGCRALAQAAANQPCALDADRPYEVVEIDPVRHRVRVLFADAAGTPLQTPDAALRYLESQGDSVIALTNAGIFEPGFRPTGLLISEGETVQALNTDTGEGNFFLMPNGVFWVDAEGRLHVDETGAFAQSASLDDGQVREATQSGPLLLDGGAIHPAFREASVNCRLRSGIGVRPDGSALLAITNGAVNLHGFASFFADQGAADALYLDGSISRLYDPEKLGEAQADVHFSGYVAVVVRPGS
jgi:uncharacterized protein YigE (DUF2233 family)